MTNLKTTPLLSLDPVISKAVDELKKYAKSQPKAVAALTVLDGILNSLIEKIRRDKNDSQIDDKSAARLLEELAALFPESPRPWLVLSKMCIDESRFEEALRYAEIGLKTQPSYPELIFNRALCLLEIKKHTEGIKEFKRYLKYVRTNPWAYNNIGDAYRSLGRPDKAERYLKKAIKLDDSFAPGYGNLALLRSDQRRYAECIELGKIAQQLGPLNKEVQLVMGEAYMSLGEHRRGLQYLVDATLLDRNFIEAYESMSAAYVELEMYELAIAAAQEALKLNPKSWMALANLGYSYAKRFKYADAIIFQNKALQCNPTPEGRYKTAWDLGWNYLQVDNYARALRWTEEAIRLKENPDVVLFFNRALILFAKGQIRRATSAYREARAMAKTLGDEQVILEAIKDIRYFVSRKGIQEQEASTLLALLDADFGPTN